MDIAALFFGVRLSACDGACVFLAEPVGNSSAFLSIILTLYTYIYRLEKIACSENFSFPSISQRTIAALQVGWAVRR